MDKRLAKTFIIEGTAAVSTTSSLCVAMFTQAHATVEGENTENMPSEDKRGRLVILKIKRNKTTIC